MKLRRLSLVFVSLFVVSLFLFSAAAYADYSITLTFENTTYKISAYAAPDGQEPITVTFVQATLNASGMLAEYKFSSESNYVEIVAPYGAVISKVIVNGTYTVTPNSASVIIEPNTTYGLNLSYPVNYDVYEWLSQNCIQSVSLQTNSIVVRTTDQSPVSVQFSKITEFSLGGITLHLTDYPSYGGYGIPYANGTIYYHLGSYYVSNFQIDLNPAGFTPGTTITLQTKPGEHMQFIVQLGTVLFTTKVTIKVINATTVDYFSDNGNGTWSVSSTDSWQLTLQESGSAPYSYDGWLYVDLNGTPADFSKIKVVETGGAVAATQTTTQYAAPGEYVATVVFPDNLPTGEVVLAKIYQYADKVGFQALIVHKSKLSVVSSTSSGGGGSAPIYVSPATTPTPKVVIVSQHYHPPPLPKNLSEITLAVAGIVGVAIAVGVIAHVGSRRLQRWQRK